MELLNSSSQLIALLFSVIATTAGRHRDVISQVIDSLFTAAECVGGAASPS